jgi:hypothetical protein
MEEKIGCKIGRLKIIKYLGYYKDNRKEAEHWFECTCDCGNKNIVKSYTYLFYTNVKLKSCGCWNSERTIMFNKETKTGFNNEYVIKNDGVYIHIKRNEKIHVIGGAGSAYGVLRELFERGFYVSAGVFSHGDSDIASARVFGIEYLEEKPFNDISDELLQDNIMYIKNADMTILCNMPFGRQNIRNLEAARYSSKLVIIENEPPEARDFTGGEAVKIYNELKSSAVAVITAAQLHEVLN